MIDIKKLLKYLVYGLIIASAIVFIPVNKVRTKDTILISMIGSISFALLDMYSPSVSINISENKIN